MPQEGGGDGAGRAREEAPAAAGDRSGASPSAAERRAAWAPFTKHEAHPFGPATDDPERCGLCGEPRIQIRHHPTRVAAACRLKGLDPRVVQGPSAGRPRTGR